MGLNDIMTPTKETLEAFGIYAIWMQIEGGEWEFFCYVRSGTGAGGVGSRVLGGYERGLRHSREGQYSQSFDSYLGDILLGKRVRNIQLRVLLSIA